MKKWLKTRWDALRAWCAENGKAHARAPVSPCCSKPPAGAGRKTRAARG